MNSIDDILDHLSRKRVEITPYLFERFVNGSPDRVLEAIASQVNEVFDHYDTTITNVLHEITTELNELRQAVKELTEKYEEACRKDQHLPRNTR